MLIRPTTCLVRCGLAALVACGCTGVDGATERFPFQRSEWLMGDGAWANGTTMAVKARLFFRLDTNAPPTGMDENCGLDDSGDVHVRVKSIPGSSQPAAGLEVKEIKLQSTLGDDACQTEVLARVRTSMAGRAILELDVRDRHSITTEVEVRDVAGVFASMEGLTRLAMVQDARSLLSVARADQNGLPLRGEPLVLSGGGGVVAVTPGLSPDAWWVMPTGHGVARLEVQGIPNVPWLEVEVVPATELHELRFFLLKVGPVNSDLVWRSIEWNEVPSGTVLLEQSTTIHVIAVPVQDNGLPVWAGYEKVYYTVPQYPVVKVSSEEMPFAVVTQPGTVEAHGLQWLSVTPLHPGTATLSATYGTLTANLVIQVRW